jgi:hypothetical protein
MIEEALRAEVPVLVIDIIGPRSAKDTATKKRAF